MKKISIITVCFNADSVIEQTINSVLSQRYENLEYIIVDGKSTDNTIEVLKKIVDKRIKWISEPDKGLYDAMNKGIEMATGEWMCFMNAGDRFVDNNTVSNVFSLEVEDNDVLYGDVILEYPPYGNIRRRHNMLSGKKCALDICHQSTFIRSSIMKKYGYDTQYRIFADIDFFYKIWKEGYKFFYVPVDIAVFEAFDGLSSSKVFTGFKEMSKVYSIKWYNSIMWWKLLIRRCAWFLEKTVLPQQVYRERKYRRIKKQNS